MVLGDRFDHPRLAFAYNESRTASEEGVEHLISLGHKRIAFAANDTDDGDHIDRLEAYRRDAQELTVFTTSSSNFACPAHRLDGAQLMRKMMSISTPPTAVFIADPLTACGAINEAHKLGLRIPEEMSILGFDDSDTRFSVEPTMTAICQDSRELGRLAYELLVQRCDGAENGQPAWVGQGLAGDQPHDRASARPNRFASCPMANVCRWPFESRLSTALLEILSRICRTAANLWL